MKIRTLIGASLLQKMDFYQDEESNLTGMLFGSGKELDSADMCVDKLDCRPKLFEFGETDK